MSYYISMDNVNVKKRGSAAMFGLCPVRHVILLISSLLIVLHLLTRKNHGLNVRLSQSFVRPLHYMMTSFWAKLPFSVAELLIAIAVIGLTVYIISFVIHIIKDGERLKRLYKLLVTLLSFAAFVYAGFCVIWGVYFYGDDFITVSGFENSPISVEELERVTVYFAELANSYCGEVERNENGLYCAERRDILARSQNIYENCEKKFPCLEGPKVPAKGIFFSRIMSYTDFTGFFFPFTAEANVNTDFPLPTFAATVAHELAHLRGVAKEQEANFVAVLACMESGDTDYIYSGALLAYVYLGNALHSADYEAWEKVYDSLDERVKFDLRLGNAYWKQFETPVQKVSNTVYEGFLQSYDQKLGMKSYGACVDLIVNYYK